MSRLVLPKTLREAMAVSGVVAEPQLVRRGWLQRVAQAEVWPRETLSVMTRTKQGHSGVMLDWYVSDDEVSVSGENFLHRACLTELMLLDDAWRQGGTVHMIHSGLKGNAWPDAEVVWRHREQIDAAIEVDAGYDWPTMRRKWTSFVAQGYQSIVWATTVHARVDTLPAEVLRMHTAGELKGLRQFRTVFVDVWSVKSPYLSRRRCHKSMSRTLVLP